MREPIFVSFYSPSYAEVAERLLASLREHRLPCVLRAVKERGGWGKNVFYRIAFLREMLAMFPNRPLVWVDADAVIRKPPVLFTELRDVDVAAYVWEPPEQKPEILSGTMYFSNTPEVRAMLGLWEFHQRSMRNETMQPSLKVAIDSVPDLVFHRLPVEYTFIFDTHRRAFPDAEPVIEHFQESRVQRK